MKHCPIENALEYVGRKWSLTIIRDLFFGKKRFKEFLEANPKLSGKVLSQRLKDLEKKGLIEKKIVSKSPVNIEYALTSKGRALNGILYEMALFSLKECKNEVLPEKSCPTEAEENLKKLLNIKR
jgi:DNA-binding HxlR family transcriptional regulator